MNNFEIGSEFEQYILDNILIPEYFSILMLSHDFNGKYFVESNLMPDIKLRCKSTKREFWIECKFRSKKNNEYTNNVKQLHRYCKLKEPVFYLFGLGAKAKEPETISLLHIDKIFNKISQEKILYNMIPKSKIKNFNELQELCSKIS